MELPELIIFDLDGTLILPEPIRYIHEVDRIGIDLPLLLSYLLSSKYQIAIATFNHDMWTEYLGGLRLVRSVLEYVVQNSINIVPDSFIQAWRPDDKTMEEQGKNIHIFRLIDAYRLKYGSLPPSVLFYDDNINNVYLANSKGGVIGYWTPRGFSSRFRALNGFHRIGSKVKFRIQPDDISLLLSCNVSYFLSFVQPGLQVHTLYLPHNEGVAKYILSRFASNAYQCGLHILFE